MIEGRVEDPSVIFGGVLIAMDDMKLPSRNVRAPITKKHTHIYIMQRLNGCVSAETSTISWELTHPAQHFSQNEAIQVGEKYHKDERKITPGA